MENKKHFVYVSTVLRRTTNKQITGYVYKILWPVGKVVRRAAIPVKTNTATFWSARGGNRGGRGIAVLGDFIYVATAISIIKYNKKLQIVDEIFNPKFCGLHEIFVDNTGILATSTVHDLVIKVDFKGKTIFEWFGSESRRMQKALQYKGRNLNLMLDFPKNSYDRLYTKYTKGERLHLNTVQVYNTTIYTFSCKKCALIKIDPKPEKVVFKDDRLRAPHNCIIIENNRILVNDTRNQCLNLYNKHTLIKRIPTKIYGVVNSTNFETAGWQRGLSRISGNRYIVGTSPASIFEINIATGKISNIVKLSNNIKHCVHGVFYV